MAADTGDFRYWAPVDRTAPNNPHAYAMQLIGLDKDVLELGCAAGHATSALVEQGCTVVGIDNDAFAAQTAAEIAADVVVADLTDPAALTKAVAGREFDVVYAGDVLEHLPDPVGVLAACRDALRPGGSVVVSLPNVAHVDVKLALLAGRFDYREEGLLDRSHLHFFTRASITRLIEDAGFRIVELRHVLRPPFDTEIELDPADVSPEVLRAAMADPEAETYQFVLRAVPADVSADLEAAAREFAESDSSLTNERARRVALEVEVSELRAKVDGLETELVEAADVARELELLRHTKTFRATAGLRRVYRALRRGK